ncbi:DNA polymerase I [Blochmannia endosymbiont of Camponotus sp. C-046]|uniref:DNA polymerase I n=1 Tax=Blochmannia endosymbiont of Camponotus sp. C-046 TaxID=2945589 RepID=UPI0020248FD8|nr:DNA polymerase I [Blochmannia endosymbiont of Camponotus sp. C-046]URJ28705.1 DNA polymerase I [Blochmannia endosymbiont of Camponotus sp. C-046]
MATIINSPIILVDGSCYIHRAYHAFPPLITSSGTPVWVIYGVINMIKSLLIRYQPTHMVVVFDTIGKTFRNNLFEQYKANRIKTPKNLYTQIDPLCEIIQAMGLPILRVPDVEADDVIGTLAVSCARSGNSVLISTGDKDMAQIVSSQITLINTMSNIILTPKEIEKQFGVPPTLIADYLALIGDRSDNIPGVPGIGKKTAQILLNKIGNLKKLYDHLDKFDILNLGLRGAKAIQKTLQINKEVAFLSYRLTTIQTNLSLNISDYQLLIQRINMNTLSSLFTQYEFTNWLIDLQSGTWLDKYHHFKNTPSHRQSNNTLFSQKNNLLLNYSKEQKTIKIIHNIEMLYHWVEKINTSKFFIFSIHTDIFHVSTANIISICLSIDTKENAYIPIKTDSINNHQNFLYLEEILSILQPILENEKIKKVSQHLKFSYSVFKRYNINLVGMEFDVILELYTLYGTSNYHDIKKFLDKDTFDAVTNFKKNYENYNKKNIISDLQNIQLQSLYASKFIKSLFNLHHTLWPKIEENDKLKKIFEEIEMPLISILSRIESYGVLIDKQLLNTHSEELDSRIHALELEAYQLVGTPFNLASTKQLQEILYNQQKLPILKKTPKGAPSTNEEVLNKLSKKYPIPKIILQYRALSKLQSTYINKLIAMINKKSNRVHTSYNQTRTSTGRLSSTSPNLQNIPNRNYDGRKIRQAFIAPKNFLIVAADYSQIELRIMAHLSQDTKLINDFLSEKDIHTATASEIFVTALHSVTDEQRQRAKTINFGLIYGMSAFGLARQLSVTCKEAQKYVDRYFNRYPGVMKYMQHIREHVNKYGYVSTLDGRKLYLPDIYSTNISQKKSAERSAINAPMQGSAADIIKKAMISIDNWLQKNEIPARIIMQVHDELVFEVHHDLIDPVIRKIKTLMEECFIMDVPLKVDIGVGKNWEQAH